MSMFDRLIEISEKYYKHLVVSLLVIIFLGIGYILYKVFFVGKLFEESVSIKGGYIITIPKYNLTKQDYVSLLSSLNYEYSIQETTDFFIIQTSNKNVSTFLNELEKRYGINTKSISIQEFNSSIGKYIFNQFYTLVTIAIFLVSTSIAIIYRKKEIFLTIFLSIVFDLLMVAIVLSLLQYPVSYMSLLGMLLIVGFAIDNNVVLATNMIKEREKSFAERAKMSLRVGILMELFVIYLALAALIFVDVTEIKEFALTLLIGNMADMIYYIFFNLSLFKYFESKHQQ